MRRSRHSPRRGAVLIAAIVCLVVAMSILSTMVAGSLTQRQQLASEKNARQVALLVVAGRDRAIARLVDDSEYDGESWRPTIAKLEATVEVRVARRTDGAATVAVTATFPADGPRVVRRSQIFTIPASKPDPQE
ncbi:hypothetical protein Pla108_21380 [Botrimarina colliarenosi]|uniref:Uncharacterized protein n=1 Tax=Botrimarina colliarenosi TaxID=2528001 RepID=A0A5C6AIC5_9BACT|nr:hypothetical protein [Botrimarina colliarenosi]TWT97983.1 hypothetical protein Pla108_21380 [Botrimarina colliarenosi]